MLKVGAAATAATAGLFAASPLAPTADPMPATQSGRYSGQVADRGVLGNPGPVLSRQLQLTAGSDAAAPLGRQVRVSAGDATTGAAAGESKGRHRKAKQPAESRAICSQQVNGVALLPINAPILSCINWPQPTGGRHKKGSSTQTCSQQANGVALVAVNAPILSCIDSSPGNGRHRKGGHSRSACEQQTEGTAVVAINAPVMSCAGAGSDSKSGSPSVRLTDGPLWTVS